MSRVGKNIYKRKDGRWEGRYIKGYNELSKAVYGFVYAKTYREVKNKLLTAQSATGSNTSSYGSKLTFADITQKWLCNISLTVKQSTYARYVFVLERHILPVGRVQAVQTNVCGHRQFHQDKTNGWAG